MPTSETPSTMWGQRSSHYQALGLLNQWYMYVSIYNVHTVNEYVSCTSDCLGCVALLYLNCCLFYLASLLLSSFFFISLTCMYTNNVPHNSLSYKSIIHAL